jgi:hypothetical protein
MIVWFTFGIATTSVLSVRSTREAKYDLASFYITRTLTPIDWGVGSQLSRVDFLLSIRIKMTVLPSYHFLLVGKTYSWGILFLREVKLKQKVCAGCLWIEYMGQDCGVKI